MKKLLLLSGALLFLLAFTASAFSIANLFDSFFQPPKITDAYLSLEKVYVGDELKITITAEDTFGVDTVSAAIEHERGTDYVGFSLTEGNSKKGTWQGTWVVHDTIEKEYIALVTVTGRHKASSSVELPFYDPVVSHTPDQITPQGAGSGLDADKLDAYQAADLLAQGGSGVDPNAYKYLYFYLTANNYNGNLGGLAGADAKCATDKPITIPSGLTYKAYLCSNTICQKPLPQGSNTIVVLARNPALSPEDRVTLDQYYIINPVKGPDYVSVYDGSWDYLKNGISGLARTGSPSLVYLGLASSGDDFLSYYFWTGSTTSATQYTNAYSLNVYDAEPSTTNCQEWTSLTGSGRVGQTTSSLTSQGGGMSKTNQNCNDANVARLLCYAS